MRYLTVHEVLVIHSRMMGRSSGAMGIRTLAGLESALAQSRMTFGGRDLYPTIVEMTHSSAIDSLVGFVSWWFVSYLRLWRFSLHRPADYHVHFLLLFVRQALAVILSRLGCRGILADSIGR